MKKSYYWAGVFTYGCLHSLFQDSMGQEGMRHIVDHHWSDSTYTVVGAIVILIIANGWIPFDWALARKAEQAASDGE